MTPEEAIEELTLAIFSIKNVAKQIQDVDVASLVDAHDSAISKIEYAIEDIKEEYDLD